VRYLQCRSRYFGFIVAYFIFPLYLGNLDVACGG
jgi:hypothetical protein